MPAKAVYLIAPGYRRWLTPDATELVFETEGFSANETKNWQARLIVTDLDGGAEATTTYPIDLSRKTFSLPVPKFHRRAEIILFIENPRDREPVCEGRWKLTNIPKEELPGLSYFDSRGVFFHEGVGRFPIIALLGSDSSNSDWSAFAAAGFTGLCVDSSIVDEGRAKLASSLKIMLFPKLYSKDAAIDVQLKELRRLQSFPAIAAYAVHLQSSSPNVFRQADSSRPLIAISPYPVVDDEDLHESYRDFQDVIALHNWKLPDRKSLQARSIRSGRAHFRFFSRGDVALRQDVDAAAFIAVAGGASGMFVSAWTSAWAAKELKASGIPAELFASPLKELQPVVNAVVRGVPEPSDDSTEDRWLWRRRLPTGERAVIEVKRGDPPTATFKMERIEKEKGERGA